MRDWVRDGGGSVVLCWELDQVRMRPWFLWDSRFGCLRTDSRLKGTCCESLHVYAAISANVVFNVGTKRSCLVWMLKDLFNMTDGSQLIMLRYCKDSGAEFNSPSMHVEHQDKQSARMIHNSLPVTMHYSQHRLRPNQKTAMMV